MIPAIDVSKNTMGYQQGCFPSGSERLSLNDEPFNDRVAARGKDR